MQRPFFPPARRPRERRQTVAPFRRLRRTGFGVWVALVALGGFGGTLAALRLAPVEPTTASASIGLVRDARIAAPSAAHDRLTARFGFCPSGGGRDCVVDGDTFWFAGEKYRIADIDTPETHPPRCAEEARLGAAATTRLRHWLNDGAFSLESGTRDTDRYGRKLRVVTRGGASAGSALVSEGLARRWEGYRRPWC